MYYIRILFMALIIMYQTVALAGIETLIKNVMPSGTMSNVSKTAIVNDQLSGHVIGGSVLLKAPPTQDFQLMSLQAPTCRLGGLPCAAQLDLRSGALSFIKAAAMEQFLKDVVQGAGGYLAIMAIKTICPQCENIMSYLEQMARNVNQFNVNGCEKGMQLAKGLHSAWEKGSEQTRQSALTIDKGGRDMSEIRQEAQKDNGSDPTSGKKELKSLLGDNFNLVWKALDQKAESGGDGKAFKELLMSISGTIIGTKDPDKGRVITRKSSLVNQKLIEQYIGVQTGQTEVELYSCDETDKCLKPVKKKIVLSAEDTMYGNIERILKGLVPKIAKNRKQQTGGLTEEEENLIALSSVPLVKKIQMELQRVPDSVNLSLTELVELLCYDVVTNHLTRLLNKTTEAVSELSYLQLADIGAFRDFDREVSNVIRFLIAARENAFRRYDVISQTKLRMRYEEEYFENNFTNFVKTND